MSAGVPMPDPDKPDKIDFRLYLITDRRAVPGGDLIEAVRLAVEGGVRAVQLREKDLSAGEIYRMAKELREVTSKAGCKLLINDRVDVAVAVGAEGVHLTGESIPIEAVRRSAGPDLTIGISAHSADEAVRAAEEGADFIVLGPVYHTPSKERYGPPIGLQPLEAAAREIDVPVFAIGGINGERIREVMSTGVHGIALISAIISAEDPRKASEALISALESVA